MRNVLIKEITEMKNIMILSPCLSIMDLINIADLHRDCFLYYFADSSGKYLGAVSKRKLLEYFGTYTFFIDRNNTHRLAAKLENVPVTEIIDSDIPRLLETGSLPEAFSILTTGNYNELPVINSYGIIIGEVTVDAILGILTEKGFKLNVSA